MTTRRMAIAAALTLATLVAQAAPKEQWLHVKVDNPAEEERVRVNVPLALVAQVIPLANIEQLNNGRIRIDLGDSDSVDVKAILAAVRQAEDGEYATIENRSSKVRVRKSKGLLLVESAELDRDSREKVNIRIPLAVADALVTDGADDELDVAAAVRALGTHPEDFLVEVEDGSERVRIWIDDTSTQKD